MTESDNFESALEKIEAQPILAQIAARLRDLAPVKLDEPVVDVLRDARERR